MTDYKEFLVKVTGVNKSLLEIEPILLPNGFMASEVTCDKYNNINIDDIVTIYLIGNILALKM